MYKTIWRKITTYIFADDLKRRKRKQVHTQAKAIAMQSSAYAILELLESINE